jgi:hypothetical protein
MAVILNICDFKVTKQQWDKNCPFYLLKYINKVLANFWNTLCYYINVLLCIKGLKLLFQLNKILKSGNDEC